MKYIIMISFIINMISCSSTDKKIPKENYQDRFWLGCFNAYTYWQMKAGGGRKIKEANDWCVEQKAITERIAGKK